MKSRNLPIKAMLLLDNTPSHTPEEELKTEDGSVFTMYVPPNTSPLFQTMDENAIRLIKLYYQKFLLTSVISKNSENLSEPLKHLAIRDAVFNLHLAWNALDQKLIEKYEKGEDADDISLSVLRAQLRSDALTKTISEVTDLLKSLSASCTHDNVNYLNNEYRQLDVASDSEEETSNDDEIVISVKNSVTNAQAIQVFNAALDWAQENNVDYSDILVLRRLQSQAVVKHFVKQIDNVHSNR